MEYSLRSFADYLRNSIPTSPYMPYSGLTYYASRSGARQELSKKHKHRDPLHLRSAIDQELKVMPYGENGFVFEIGSEKLEEFYPHYHILQQAKYIRKRGKGTKRSKGSQDLIANKKQRDYEKVSWNGKTYSKEYSKNVRGSRQKKSTQVAIDYQGKTILLNKDSGQYLNRHYQWIDKLADYSANELAQQFGLKLKRKEQTSLEQDFLADSEFTTGGESNNFANTLSDIINSFTL